MTNTLDIRRRRAAWRASHRGTKELDLIVGGYAEAHLAAMDEAALSHFEDLLGVPDPELQAWLLGPDAEYGRFADLIGHIRIHCGRAS